MWDGWGDVTSHTEDNEEMEQTLMCKHSHIAASKSRKINSIEQTRLVIYFEDFFFPNGAQSTSFRDSVCTSDNV